MYTKILKKPKDICISAINSALSQISGIDNLRKIKDKVKFNWTKRYRYKGEYQSRGSRLYGGKILFEGDETTKVTVILNPLYIYLYSFHILNNFTYIYYDDFFSKIFRNYRNSIYSN